MIKVIAFDLDGTLLGAKEIHYESLNKALDEFYDYKISREEHLNIFDGLSTNKKLDMLVERGDIPADDNRSRVYDMKQKYTFFEIENNIKQDNRLIEVMEKLSKDYLLACVSNAIEQTVEMGLIKLGIRKYFSLITHNSSTNKNKPYPDPYEYTAQYLGVKPQQMLAVEDNMKGFQSALTAGCYLLKVKSPDDVTYQNIYNKISAINKLSKEVEK